MKSAQLLSIASAILVLTSCSSFRPQSPLGRIRPLSNGEAKLTTIQMPEKVHENLPYDVILGFRSNGAIKIEKVCFTWLSRQPSFSTSSASCLMDNAEANGEGNGTQGLCRSEIPVTTANPGSNQFCVGASHIRMQSPERLVVRIRPENLHGDYNMIEARVEYVYKGVARETNIVQTPIAVDK